MSTLILALGGGEASAAAVYRAASTADPAPASILGIGAALSLLGLRRISRRRREATHVPRRWFRRRAVITVQTVPSAPWIEGRSQDPTIGEFAGFVFAKAALVPAGGDGDRRGTTRYWLHDARKSAPVWVRPEDIGQCRWPRRADRPQPVPVRRSILDEDVEAPVAIRSAVARQPVGPVERAEESAATAVPAHAGPSRRRRRGSRARQAA